MSGGPGANNGLEAAAAARKQDNDIREMEHQHDGVAAVTPPLKRPRIIVSPDSELGLQPMRLTTADSSLIVPTATLAVATMANTNDSTRTSARRSILNDGRAPANAIPEEDQEQNPPASKRRLVFGRPSDVDIPDNVLEVYKLIRKQTGAIGGNGSFGAIYGELTCGSMQKMINLMQVHAELSQQSKFMDVGSGLGKPSLHVAQLPVAFSYGIEMERTRWMLGMANLKAVLEENNKSGAGSHIGHKCLFQHANIMAARTFHPFTHVYMFSIGFPPDLWVVLSEIFNRSTSPYLICYHSPKAIIDNYGFNVELVAQTSTSMHGSSEGHMGYIYRRTGGAGKDPMDNCDPLFQEAYDVVQNSSPRQLLDHVNSQVHEQYKCGRRTRSSKIVMCAEPKTPQKRSGRRVAVPS